MLGNVHDHHLLGGQPQRERPGEVLDQDPQEPLHGAHNGPVEHDRAPLAAVGPHVTDPEPVRHGAVDLNRREGPGALEGVAEVERDLGAVEGPVPGRERVLEARPGETLLQHALGLVPESRLAEELLRPGLDRDRDVGEAEVVIDLAGHPQEEPELLEDATQHEPVDDCRRSADARA